MRKENKKRKSGSNPVTGHISAIAAVCIWGATFTLMKNLLNTATVFQLMPVVFLLGWLTLLIINPRILKPGTLKDELRFAVMGVAGFFGFCLFTTLGYNSAGQGTTFIMLSLIPLAVLIFLCVSGRKNKLKILHIIGVVIGIAGVAIVCGAGSKDFEFVFSPAVVGLMLGAVLCRGFYSVFLDMMHGGRAIAMARRMVMWAFIVSLVVMFMTDGLPSLSALTRLSSVIYLVGAGCLGSGIAYALWNVSAGSIGVEKTTNYLYLVPAASFAFSCFVMKQGDFSPVSLLGVGLALIGMVVSDLAE